MMQKKMLLTACATAVLSLTAGLANAADVQVYGLVDEGLMFQHVNKTGEAKTHSLTMESGIAGASRWGIKGGEALGDGYRVNFVLEGKFSGDDGSMGSKEQLFDRDSYLELVTPYGSVQAGRTGMLTSGTHGGIFAGQTNPFGVVYKTAGANGLFQSAAQRVSNMLRYESPSMAGVKLYAQYSNATGLGSDASEGNDALPSSQRDRYGAVGATYRNGGLRLAVVGDYYFYHNNTESTDYKKYAGRQNPRSISLAANYDFGDFKLYGGYQYGKNLRSNVLGANVQEGDGNMFMLGASYDIGAGTLMASAGYAKVGSFTTYSGTTATEKELDAWQLALGYKYKLSKRTMIYCAAAYRDADLDSTQTKNGRKTDKSVETKTSTVMMGLQHKF